MAEWEEWFGSHVAPSEVQRIRPLLERFCRHHEPPQRIALVTSGGTTVPLEHNTVRFVDNFSAGARGAASAEYFLEHGYAVIFMHRHKSLEPFTRHFTGKQLMDALNMQGKDDNVSIEVRREYVNIIGPILHKYEEARDGEKILYISFTTVADYLWLLRTVCEYLVLSGPYSLLYLAAAVSDFYVPSNRMPTHKIQSGDGAPIIQLQIVPKMLSPLVNLWVPKAYVVSFKLETDENLLISKSRESLEKYKHKLVIANNLQTRRSSVVFVTPLTSFKILLTDEEIQAGKEIESPIVNCVIQQHNEHINQMLTL